MPQAVARPFAPSRRAALAGWRTLSVLLVLAALLAVAACAPSTSRHPPPAAPPPVVTEAPEPIAPQVEMLPEEPAARQGPAGARDTITVALLAPLSGPNGPLGQALLNAAQMALFEIGAAAAAQNPNGAEISLAPRDTGGTREGAERAAQEALASGAKLILGPFFAAEVQAVAPLARARAVPVVAFTNDYTVAGDGVYILGFTPEAQVERVVGHAAAQGASRFAALVPASVYGERLTAALQAAAEAVEGTVAKVETYDPALTTNGVTPVVRRLADYNTRRAALLAERKALAGKDDDASRAALRRLEKMETIGDVDFDAVLIAESGERLKIIAPLLLYFDIDPRRVRTLGTMDWDTPETWTEPALVGGWYPTPAEESHRTFAAGYRAAFGAAPPPRASLGYDATALAVVLARKSARDPFAPEALTAGNGFTGVDGIFRLLPSGVVERGLAVKEVGTRNARIVSPAPQTFEKLTN